MCVCVVNEFDVRKKWVPWRHRQHTRTDVVELILIAGGVHAPAPANVSALVRLRYIGKAVVPSHDVHGV